MVFNGTNKYACLLVANYARPLNGKRACALLVRSSRHALTACGIEDEATGCATVELKFQHYVPTVALAHKVEIRCKVGPPRTSTGWYRLCHIPSHGRA